MKRVALYVRVSTREQKLHGLSVDSQIDALKTYCEEHHLTIINIYNDAGISARKKYTKRPALLQLIEDIKKEKIDLVLFTKLDRWFRSVADYYEVQSVLDQCKVPWRAIWEDYETETSNGIFKVNIMLSVAQQEADTTSERIRSVNDYRREKGLFLGGNAPRGYKNIKGKLVIDELEQPYIEKFFQTYLETFSPTKAIASVSDHFTVNRQVCLKMLRNETYCGNASGSTCPQYITKEEHDIIVRSIDGRRRRESDAERIYIFSGLIRCPECGSSMTGRMYRRDKYEYKMYHCLKNTASNEKCRNGGNVYEKKLEEFLLSELDKIISDKNIEIIDKNMRKEDISSEIAKLNARIERIGMRFEFGDITLDEYKQKRNEIKRKIDDLNSQTLEEIPKLPDGWKEIYNELTDESKKSFWSGTIRKIDVLGKGRKKGFRISF